MVTFPCFLHCSYMRPHEQSSKSLYHSIESWLVYGDSWLWSQQKMGAIIPQLIINRGSEHCSHVLDPSPNSASTLRLLLASGKIDAWPLLKGKPRGKPQIFHGFHGKVHGFRCRKFPLSPSIYGRSWQMGWQLCNYCQLIDGYQLLLCILAKKVLTTCVI